MMRLKTGWKMTRVTGARWPLSAYFSGGRGIHSEGVRLSRVGAPLMNSFSASLNFASSSLTCGKEYMSELELGWVSLHLHLVYFKMSYDE